MTSPLRFARYLANTMVLTFCALLAYSATAAAQEPPKTTPSAEKAERKKAEKLTGHLPPYYKGLVNDDQRQQIYKIMADYAPKLGDLRAQLIRTSKEQEEKIEALLTPEQKQKLAQLKAAKSRHQERKTKASSAAPAKQESGNEAKTVVQPQSPTEAKK